MQAICVTPDRELEVRDIARPDHAAPGHVLVDMVASAINRGDKTFLRTPAAAGGAMAPRQHDVWGASGAGRVIAVGEGVPAHYAGRQVALYRSLGRSAETVGLWCETAQVPYTSCLILPEHVPARDYCGSLVNAMTAYAFLDEVTAAGHGGVIATAGNSATGYALTSLARRRKLPAILLVRTAAARRALLELGAEHVIVTGDGHVEALGALAAELGTTAVFDGVGGDLLSQIAPCLPENATVYCYGVLGGAGPFSLHASLLMMKNLTIRRFSNFNSRTVTDRQRLAGALAALEDVIGDPMFATRIGESFRYDQIALAMAYEARGGAKAILVA